MITNIKLKFSRTPDSICQSIETTPITIFVGPNNSGKSLVITEIAQYCQTGNKNPNALILDEVIFDQTDKDKARILVERMIQPAHHGEAISAGHIFVGRRGVRIQVPHEQLLRAIENPLNNISNFCQWFLTFDTLVLDGQSRMNLVNSQIAGDMQQPASSSLQVLFRDDEKRREVRRIVFDAFNLYFVIDPTNLGQFRIRLSANAPHDDMEERGIHENAVKFHSKAQLIDNASDGVKAFTGIITEIIAGDPQIILIDEPEAFLHPSLASKLGYEVSQAALKSNKRIFVSTHSSNFVMGCIQSGAPVNIIRLTYRSGISTSRILSNDKILTLMRNPLLRSTGVLNGLFYEFVVVTESDTDRAFYQEINERLLRYKPEWGIPNCLFINAQNKQTIQTIIKPLRELGIPAAGIVDVDILKEGGTVWSNLMNSASVPEMKINPLGQIRASIKKAIDYTGKDMKRNGGIYILEGNDRKAAEDLLDNLSEYGVFVVPRGELESWLSYYQISGHGPAWLVDMFNKMGENPDSGDYLLPSDGDVWQFINKIRTWLINPTRKGIPI